MRSKEWGSSSFVLRTGWLRQGLDSFLSDVDLSSIFIFVTELSYYNSHNPSVRGSLCYLLDVLLLNQSSQYIYNIVVVTPPFVFIKFCDIICYVTRDKGPLFQKFRRNIREEETTLS